MKLVTDEITGLIWLQEIRVQFTCRVRVSAQFLSITGYSTYGALEMNKATSFQPHELKHTKYVASKGF
jgi:hypothetical protein